MATGNSQSKLMDEIEDSFLLCKICFEVYKRPKTLVCLHVFCEDCLEKTADAEFERSYRYMLYTRTVNCPICRKKTELPGGGVRRLPDNFLVANLADVLNRKKSSVAAPSCEICKPNGNNKAVSKCLDCCKLLCKVCVDLHRKTKVTSSHGLYDVEVEKDVECKTHPDEVVRFYCEPCEMCICVVCTFQEHKGHDVASFTEGMAKYAHSLDTLLSACKERMTGLREQVHLIVTCEEEIKQTEDHIRDVAIDSIGAVRKKEKDMMACLRQAYQPEITDFLKSKDDLQDALETIQSTCSLTDIILKDKSIEILLLKKEIQQKLEGLLSSTMASTPEKISQQVKFVPGGLTFGYLDVDGRGKPEDYKDMDYTSHSSSKPSESVDVQTNIIDIKESATTMGQLQKDFNTPKKTQTERVELEEKGTSPVLRETRSECTMVLPETRESCTMTPCTPTMRRRVQTAPIPSAEQGTSAHVDTSHKFTNTLGATTTERSTLTKRLSYIDEITDTAGLVFRRDQQTTTPIRLIRSAGTLTDLVRQINQSTSTISPDLKDKMTSTPMRTQYTRETMTPLVTMLDMGTTAKLLGTDKACATRTTITSNSSVRGTDVRTRDQQSETPWDRRLRLTLEKGTMPDLQTADTGMRTEGCVSHDRNTYTNFFNMEEKSMETDGVIRADVSTGTETKELVHKGVETVKRKTSDKGVHVEEKVAKLETKSCMTQTRIHLQQYIPEPNTEPCHRETNTPVVCQTSQETSTIHIQLVEMGVGSPSVDIKDTGVGDGNAGTADAQMNTAKTLMSTKGMVTTKFINPSKQTNTAVVQTGEMSMETERLETKDSFHDAYKGDMRDTDMNTDLAVTVKPLVAMSDVSTSSEATALEDKAVGTAVVSVSHQSTATWVSTATLATNTEVRREQDAQTTMSSRVHTAEVDTETQSVETSDSGCGTLPLITLSTGTETRQIVLTDSGMETNRVETEAVGVGCDVPTAETSTEMPHVEFTDAGVDPQPKVMLEKLVGTSSVKVAEKGVGHVRTLTHTRSTGMSVVETKSVETHTHVPTVEKATYMPQTVTITAGTSTVGVEMVNKQVNTPQKDIVDSGTMTACKKYVDQDTTMERGVRYSETSTSTRHISIKDTASDAVVTPLQSSATNTPLKQVSDVETSTKPILTLTASTSTQHRVTTSDQLTGTPQVSLVDKETASLIGPSTDCSTMTHIPSRSVGVLKRPDAVSRGTVTSNAQHVESSTGMDVPYTKDGTAMTEVPETAEKGITSKPIGLITQGTGTPTKQHTEIGTSMPVTEMTARGSSPIRPNLLDRGSSPIAVHVQLAHKGSSPFMIPTANKKIGVKARTTDSYTSPANVESKEQGTGDPLVSVTDRQCSPVCFEEYRPKGTDVGTSMAHLEFTERETSPLLPYTKDSFTATTRVRLTETGSSPIRIPTRSCGVHVGVAMETKESGTPTVYTSDAGTEMPQIYLSDSGTSTVRVSLSEKETCTPTVCQKHKTVSTENAVLVDASTPAPVDIMAAYLEAIRPARPVTVARGTGTEPVVTETKRLSPVRWLHTDKACSPLRIIKCDKAVSVRGKGEIMEPVDKFHKAGGSRTRPKRPVADSSKPKLACITEDAEKASSEDEDGFAAPPAALPGLPSFPRHRLRPRPSLFGEAKPMMKTGGFGTGRTLGGGFQAARGGAITHTERLWQSAPRLGVAAQRGMHPPSQSRFTGETGRGSPILMKVEMGTNTSDVTTETGGTSTPPIDRHDKAMCTETVTVDGKMAECISKLGTVRQRLEQSPVYSQAGSTIDAPKMALSPPIQSTMAAKTSSLLLLQARSKSLSEGLDESGCSPFVSPLTLRKANAVLESLSETSDSEKTAGLPAAPQSPRTRQALARKQRLDLSQMLRSSSMPERDHPPFSPLPKPKIHHPKVIPPLEIGQGKPPTSLRRPKARKATRPMATFAQTPELDEEEEMTHSDEAATEKSKKESQRDKLPRQLPFEERRAITRSLLHPISDSGSSSGSDSSGAKSPSHFRPQRQIPKPRPSKETKLSSPHRALKDDKKYT